MSAEKPRRSTGRVSEDGYLPNGKPDLSPTAGYENTKPVQYSDETDTQFAGRMAMWESAYATAKDIEAGGATKEGLMTALDARYDAEKASIEAQTANDTKAKSSK